METQPPWTTVVGQVWFTPQSYAHLAAAISAAGLPKRDQLPTYAKFVAEFDRTTRELEEQGIMSKRVSINAASMLEWCCDHNTKPDEASRKKYIQSEYGDNPMRRIREMKKRAKAAGVDYRAQSRRGTLCCWDGVDARWGR